MPAPRGSPQVYTSYDLDSDASYQTFLSKVATSTSSNFAIHFNGAEALAAADLDVQQLGLWILNHESKVGVRWIHFWSHPDQRPVVEHLASKYEISPRLLSLICPQKGPVTTSPPSDPGASPTGTRHRRFTFKANKTNDVENVIELKSGQRKPLVHVANAKDLSFADIVNNLWHFHSVDWGHKYVHVGVNVLSVVPGLEHNQMSDRPAGQRLWTSILLCEDGTVISSFERPPRYQSEAVRKASNELTKRHVLSILKHISRGNIAGSSGDNDLMNIRIRPEEPGPSSSPKAMSKSAQMEYASLLFYYLFDDWMTTFALIAQREHPYRHSLETVRQALAEAPDAKLLETLHSIGRQLTVLQLMYQSYGTVITRLLHRYQRTTYTATNLNPTSPFAQQGTGASNAMNASPDAYLQSSLHDSQDCINSFSTATPTVQLSFLAVGRFERLLDRVHLYALNEINHCLSEKESLVLMTFNLLALSESRSVEKLTRTTILLAKATILFLPVSLLTGYFSVSVGDIDTLYSLKTYWVSFLVVTVISILFLYGFGLATDTVEGKLVYKSLHRALWDKTVAVALRRARRP